MKNKQTLEREFFIESTQRGLKFMSREKLESYTLWLVQNMLILQDTCKQPKIERCNSIIARLDLYIDLQECRIEDLIENYLRSFGLNICGCGYMGKYFNIFGDVFKESLENFLLVIDLIEDFSVL